MCICNNIDIVLDKFETCGIKNVYIDLERRPNLRNN